MPARQVAASPIHPVTSSRMARAANRLTIHEAAEFLGIKPDTIYRLRRRDPRFPPGTKEGTTRYWTRHDLTRWQTGRTASVHQRLHRSYDGLAPEALVSVDDIAAIADVKVDTARRYTRRAGFPGARRHSGPAGTVEVWQIGPVVDWLCAAGYLAPETCGGAYMTRAAISDLTGVPVETLKIWQFQRAKMPAPDGPRVGKHPTWKRATIEAWWSETADRRRKVEA